MKPLSGPAISQNLREVQYLHGEWDQFGQSGERIDVYVACAPSGTTILGMGDAQRTISPVRDESWHRPGLSPLLALLLLAITAVLSSCVTQSIVVVGESPLPPASDIPIVSISVVDDEGAPVVGATIRVAADDQRTVSDALGLATIEWHGQPVSVSVDAAGFFPGAVAVEAFDDEAFALALRPVVLRGTVSDSSGFGLGGSTVALGDHQVVTDENGRFELSRAQSGTITAFRPGWHSAELEWDGEALVTDISLAPRIIRGLHIGPNVVGDKQEWLNMLDVADETVVNAFVVDVKDETGRVFYNSQVTRAREVGAVQPLFDLKEVIQDMDARDLYKIARVVAFEDPLAARAAVEMAVLDEDGFPYNSRGQYFLDPSDPDARAYALDIAEEVCTAGMDEIQFDYVRYPAGFPEGTQFDLPATAENRANTIAAFLDEAADVLHPLGCAVAADVFGFVTSVDHDGGIGQQFSMLSSSVDVLSPMIYPSHYSTGWFGFDVPNDHPGSVVGGALDDGVTRIEGAAIVRPWLQDFYYDSDQVRAQIIEAESRALGWMLWNSLSNFQWEALDDDPSVATTTTTSDQG